MDPRHRRGRIGEEIGAEYLRDRGWAIEARNWRAGHSEIDLVARRGDTVAFVEVKTRGSPGCGHPLEWVTARKRREVEAAARAWLRTRGRELGGGFTVRFDAVAVEVRAGRAPRIRYVEDAWRVGDG